MRKPKALNPPARIFLQVGDIQRDCDFHDCQKSGEVTWCDLQVSDSDIEYRLVRPSRHKQRSAGKSDV